MTKSPKNINNNAAPMLGDFFAIEVGEKYAVGRIFDFSGKNHPLQWAFNSCYLTLIIDRLFSKIDLDNKLYLHNDSYLAPDWTNKMGWDKGIFCKIDNVTLSPHDIPHGYSFRDSFGNYYDEFGVRITNPTTMCGEWGVASYRMLIRKAETLT
jgi:Immunity protein 26